MSLISFTKSGATKVLDFAPPIVPFGLLFSGLTLLVWGGGDGFVEKCGLLAQSLGVSPFVIGLTVLAFGRSAPEIVVALRAVWEGAHGIAISNIVGSNIANILMVLGVAALLMPVNSDEPGIGFDYFAMATTTCLYPFPGRSKYRLSEHLSSLIMRDDA